MPLASRYFGVCPIPRAGSQEGEVLVEPGGRLRGTGGSGFWDPGSRIPGDPLYVVRTAGSAPRKV